MHVFGTSLIRSLILALSLLTAIPSFAQDACSAIFQRTTAFDVMNRLRDENLRQSLLRDETPRINKSFGSDMPIRHAYEKEGLLYEEIALWFPGLKKEAISKLKTRFDLEKTLSPRKPKFMDKWLMKIKPQALAKGENKDAWKKMTAEQRLAELMKLDDPFAVLSVKERAYLFENEILNFDDVSRADITPEPTTIGDDIGSYEVRSAGALADRNAFRRNREEVEKYLEGKVGHQHKFHAWPEDAKARQEIAPYYIEKLDATTQYLWWRQMKRNPEDVSSILVHPYLGLYTRASLERLHRAVINNDAKRFKNKFRMIGARAFPGSKELGQREDQFVADWELRSGNKGVKRDFIEETVEARLVSGDYTGLRDFRSYDFNPSAPVEQIAGRFVGTEAINTLKKFEEVFPAMNWSPAKTANNHFRNRILSPLMPYENRLNLNHKLQTVRMAQKQYADRVVKVAEKYIEKIEKEKLNPTQLGELREKMTSKLEEAMFAFAKKARLDLDFERYLMPPPTRYPQIQVKSTGPIDVNKIDLGIEYSFRFPMESKPEAKDDAAEDVNNFANQLAEANGTRAEAKTVVAAHGHGISSVFKVPDAEGKVWRAEWDGIQRKYNKKGKVKRAWGGHIEVASPRFSPQQVQGDISRLFQTARANSLIPSRAAGGGHGNFDLTFLKNLPPEQASRMILNLVSYFENNQQLMLFMWMHPQRSHAARPIDIHPKLAEDIRNFRGDLIDLGKLLYKRRYFNTLVGRKPKYVPINLTPLMTPVLPAKYRHEALDIKNPQQQWFPSFGNVEGRGEARFFDAPTNEQMAGLQIKYMRALMNKAFNSPEAIDLAPKYSQKDLERWKDDPEAFLKEAKAHLAELGLDSQEFMPLLWDSFTIRNQFKPAKKKNSEKIEKAPKYDLFLKPVDPRTEGATEAPSIERAG